MNNIFYNKINKYGFWLILGVVVLFQIKLGLGVGYPPSNEQLSIWTGNVFFIRLISFLMIVIGLYLLYKSICLIREGKFVGKIFLLIMFSSPIVMVLWLTRPIESFKFFIILLGLYFILRSKRFLIWIIVLVISIFFINNFLNLDKANINNIINQKELKRQTEEKFLKEDDLVDRIILPIWYRRISYNKISLLARNLSKELISFWNLEDYFYQEFSPSSKKALVIFFWPLVIPFMTGLFALSRNKSKYCVRLILLMLIFSYTNYLFSSSTDNFRLLLAIPLVGLIIAFGFDILIKIKWIYALVLILWIYGWQIFLYDFNKRTDFWLDNRPFVYKHIFNNLINIDSNQVVNVTNLAGNAKKYCIYYLKDKCGNNFVFENFDLKDTNGKNGQIYAGFAGEFLGSDINNSFPYNTEDLIISKGFKKINVSKVRDSVAYRYGELIFVGLKQ